MSFSNLGKLGLWVVLESPGEQIMWIRSKLKKLLFLRHIGSENARTLEKPTLNAYVHICAKLAPPDLGINMSHFVYTIGQSASGWIAGSGARVKAAVRFAANRTYCFHYVRSNYTRFPTFVNCLFRH
jgi:hypothetical protein